MLTGIINERVLTHQFDECDITMQDINNIIEEIVKAFGGVTHTRMKYPTGDKKW
jgi:membrane-associated HD superfamily phosphohydrolase